jgi:glycosyltransferase involved in cell wall biosynthesis
MLHNLQQLDVFVSVAIDEGCPNALLEAMLAARPIVAYATGAIPELIRDGQEGLVLKPATTEHLVRSLHSLWERPDWAADLGRAARQRVLEMYNPAKEQGEWLNCYAIALTGQ